MLRRKVIVRDVHGIHARRAVSIVKACRDTDSMVRICRGRQNADASSIIDLLLLDVESGNEVEIVAEGKEEEIAMRKVMGLF
jgi:phosphotransferase system HPr (HPr) family protein